jgi:hypothetical protein
MAASTFSVTISSASRRACLPPRISFIIRSPTTWFASTASFIRELNTRGPFIRRMTNPFLVHHQPAETHWVPPFVAPVPLRERLIPPDNKNLRRFRLLAKVSDFA